MINIATNFKAVKRGLRSIHPAIAIATPEFFRDQQGKMQENAKGLVGQVVYVAVSAGKYVRRGTSTGNLGILNSVVSVLKDEGDGVVLGILSGSSAAADTIPKTARGRAVADTYAAFMITGGGFLKKSGTDVRDFLEVWVRFFEITLPYAYLRDVVNPSIKGVL